MFWTCLGSVLALFLPKKANCFSAQKVDNLDRKLRFFSKTLTPKRFIFG